MCPDLRIVQNRRGQDHIFIVGEDKTPGVDAAGDLQDGDIVQVTGTVQQIVQADAGSEWDFAQSLRRCSLQEAVMGPMRARPELKGSETAHGTRDLSQSPKALQRGRRRVRRALRLLSSLMSITAKTITRRPTIDEVQPATAVLATSVAQPERKTIRGRRKSGRP
ncbi:hypothetical protein GCM10009670_30660 [Citricoccus alkalitolerans]